MILKIDTCCVKFHSGIFIKFNVSSILDTRYDSPKESKWNFYDIKWKWDFHIAYRNRVKKEHTISKI